MVVMTSMKNLYKYFICVLLASFSNFLDGATHFTLRLSATNNNLGLSMQESKSGSASISFDLGDIFQIGVTHRQAFNKSEGYEFDKTTSLYYLQEETMHNMANSLD
jgi:hypothetical protein